MKEERSKIVDAWSDFLGRIEKTLFAMSDDELTDLVSRPLPKSVMRAIEPTILMELSYRRNLAQAHQALENIICLAHKKPAKQCRHIHLTPKRPHQ